MSSKKRRIKKKKHYRILFIALLIVIAIFYFYKESGKEELQPEILRQVQPKEKHEILPIQPREKHGMLPKVAIVIDDLGHNKKSALRLFNINASLTLSILPHKPFTVWIANEGHRRGHDIIGHIPMEAKEPLSLGKGGLYAWMTDDEIRETLEEGLNSIPHIKGVSNHMGSAFTEDERTMDVVISVLKEEGLFFLDSFTTPRSVGARLAREQGIKTLKRDIFLDNKNNPAYIEAQWKKLVKVAEKKGYAVAIAHQKKNTIEFLEKILSKNEVIVVPLSKLTASHKDM